MTTQYQVVSWKQYQTLALKLAAGVLSQSPRPEQIVAVSRGGLTLGHLLSDFLRVPISTITIQSYQDIKTHGEIDLTEKLQTPIHGKQILLVDDVANSGKTLNRAIAYLRKLQPAAITTLAMFYKPHSVFRPDIYAKQTQKWIIFPYEITEMTLFISHKMQLEGKSKAEIQRVLERLRFSPEQIAFVRKYHDSNNY